MHSEEDYVLFLFFFFCLWKFLCYEMIAHKVVVQRVKVQLQPRMLHIHVENRSYLPFPLC